MNEVPRGTPPFWKSRSAIVMTAFAAIAVFFLFTEHRAHVLGILPYLLLLSCPLMHLFMHHGHGHGHHSHSVGEEQTKSGDDHERLK